MVKLGIEKLLESPARIKGKNIGLIANATSISGRYKSSVSLLYNHSGVKLKSLFGPQQGFWGETQDNMIEWKAGEYPLYNLPLYSLYGSVRKPTSKMLDNIDILIFDLQDIGTRVYTYIWTMVLAMQACAENKKEFIVCDRPNPINGIQVEGNISSRDFSSFVALYPLPMRHGMTSGEVAKYINVEFKIGCELTVVEMEGWNRGMWYDETGLPWVIPSANMPTLDTATVYPGSVIFEGTNISEGRGTTRPFEFIGAPFINGFELAEALTKYKLEGVIFRPCIFIPTFQKHKGENCGGVQMHVNDRMSFSPFKTGLSLLKAICELSPDSFEWKNPPYEYVHDKPPIDVIFGNEWIRQFIETNRPIADIFDKINVELNSFKKIRSKYLLY